MALHLAHHIRGTTHELRYAPTQKRVRALVGGQPAVDSTDALLVWEPKRILAMYAVPATDVLADLVEAGPPTEGATSDLPEALRTSSIIWPGVPFAIHSTAGQPLTVRLGDDARDGAGFRPTDPDLGDRVLLDFDAFDTWLEEDDEIRGHPRDPYHRVDVRQSSRPVRVELDGQVLAESVRPMMVFETGLPMRAYLPKEDVRMDLLRPSDTTSLCAYKGEASYWSLVLDGHEVPDLVWGYEHPLPGADAIAGYVAFPDKPTKVVVGDVHTAGRPEVGAAAS